jgi:hypothetical protein
MATQAKWKGKSGTEYTFNVYQMDGKWNPVPGVYIFSVVENGYWQPIYIGQCVSFQERISSAHHKWSDALRRGATHVHAMHCDLGEAARRSIEADLLARHTTPCNEVLN